MLFCPLLLGVVLASTSSCKNSTCFTSCKDSYGHSNRRRLISDTATPTAGPTTPPPSEAPDHTEMWTTFDCMEQCYDYPWLEVDPPTPTTAEPLFTCNGTTAKSVWPGRGWVYNKSMTHTDIVLQNCSYACGPCELPKGYGPTGEYFMYHEQGAANIKYNDGKVKSPFPASIVSMDFNPENYTMSFGMQMHFSNVAYDGFAFTCLNEPYKLKPARDYYNAKFYTNAERHSWGLELLLVKDGVVLSECLRRNFATYGITLFEQPIWLQQKWSRVGPGLHGQQSEFYRHSIWMNYGVTVPFNWTNLTTSPACADPDNLYFDNCQNGTKTYYVYQPLMERTASPTPMPTCPNGDCQYPWEDQQPATGLSTTMKGVIAGVSVVLLAVIVAVAVFCHKKKGKKAGNCLSDSLVEEPTLHFSTPQK